MLSLRVNVRALAEFACEGGDLCPAAASAEAMRQGVRSHQSRQSGYGAEEVKEAALSGEYPVEDGSLRLYGRADGIRRGEEEWIIEEIKWTARALPADFSGEPAHWLQACLYALLLCDRDALDKCSVRLVYIDACGDEKILSRVYDRSSLYSLFLDAALPYYRWTSRLAVLREARLTTAKGLPFPFPSFRLGQQLLSRNAYVALRDGKYLVCEAPTGLGKTMAALYAAARALGEGHIQRVFFLTARGTGKRAAEDALRLLSESGLRARIVTLWAKAAVCIRETPLCDPAVCPRARGYYDRRRQAIAESLEMSVLDRDSIRSLAEKYCLCPFELSLDLSETADYIICDYNYAFDPRVRLERFFQGRTGAGLLVDEAHNLPDRAREMFSALMDRQLLVRLRREMGKAKGRTQPAYRALSAFLKYWKTEMDAPPALGDLPEGLVSAAEKLKAGMERAGEIDNEAYWSAVWFLRAAHEFDPACDRAVTGRDRAGIWCMEPGVRLEKCLKKTAGAAFFSATLQPLSFYRDRLGAREDNSALLALPSPFPRENLRVSCAPVSTRFRDRERTLPRVVRLISDFAREVPGNIMVCFPSYAYLEAVRSLFPADDGHVWQYQSRNMDDDARRAFLLAFEGACAGAFVTLGGLFSEGIDLTGDRLVGVVVVSAGLPQMSFETESLRIWYDAQGQSGFDFVYAYPGAARVTQAVGRLIRTDDDRGRALLIDDRWLDPDRRALLPAWWSMEPGHAI